MHNIVFLYTELAGYLLACINELAKREGVQVHIFRWPVNNEAPFTFDFKNNVDVYDRKSLTTHELLQQVKQLTPAFIYCSGWVDKGYLQVCKQYKSSIPVVVGFDNHWTGSPKQVLAAILSWRLIKPYFNYCWVPGEKQKSFALKLGFKDETIRTGFYAADFQYFNQFYKQLSENKQSNFPKRLLYVGRYYDFKGLDILWQAFSRIAAKFPDWELWCLGTGDLVPMQHPQIKHFGFIQPADMAPIIAQTGVFVLPSKFEPWGVVLHEFAAAGFPLLCSTAVGAAECFLKDGINGYCFKPDDVDALVIALEKMMNQTPQQLLLMGHESAQLAESISPVKWANTITQFLSL